MVEIKKKKMAKRISLNNLRNSDFAFAIICRGAVIFSANLTSFFHLVYTCE